MIFDFSISTRSITFFERWTYWIIKRRASALVFTAVMTAVFSLGIGQITINNANEQWFRAGDETVQRYKDFQAYYGSDKFIIFLIPVADAISTESLQVLDQLETDLREFSFADVPAFDAFTHLGNVRYIDGDAFGMEVIELTDGIERTPQGMEELTRRIERSNQYEGLLYSPDRRFVTLLAEIPIRSDDDKFHGYIAREIRKLLQAPEYKDVKLAGGPMVDAELDALTVEESRLFGSLSALLNILVLIFLFKRLPGVFYPGVVVGGTIIWTFGTAGFLGVELGVVHVILPMMLVSVGISDAVHVLSDYQREYDATLSRSARVAHTISQVGLPCSLTTLTTCAGMLSLLLAPIPPIQSLGLLAAIGVFYALVLTLVTLPALLSYADLPPRAQAQSLEDGHDRWDRMLLAIAGFNRRFYLPISLVSLAVIGASLFWASQVELETDFVKSFKPSHPLRSDFEFIDNALGGGTSSLQVIIDSGKEGGVKEPEFMKAMLNYQLWVEENFDGVMATTSVANIVREVHKVMMDGDPKEYRIPDTRPAIASELLLYENGDPDGLFRTVTDDYRFARVDVRTKTGGSHHASRLMQMAEQKAEEMLPPESSFKFTGISQLFVQMTKNLSSGQIRSYSAAAVMIFIMMLLVLRSIKLGVLSMVPNLLPIVITLGLMGILKIPLDFATLLIACIAIGIAVDDTIHLLIRYKRSFQKSRHYGLALETSLTTSGRAMLFTTLILCAGFLMFAPSDMISIARFGMLVALTLILALVADFFVMPSLMFLFQPLGKEDYFFKEPTLTKAQPSTRAPQHLEPR